MEGYVRKSANTTSKEIKVMTCLSERIMPKHSTVQFWTKFGSLDKIA